MIMERASMRKPMVDVNSPAAIHVKISFSKTLASAGRLRNSIKIMEDTTNDANKARHATHDTTALGILRPKKALIRKPTAGKTGMSQI
jgi:hypothetical protein